MRYLSTNKAFTLLEMSVVLVIMAALLGGGISTFLAYTAKEGYQNTELRIKKLEAALVAYRKAYNRLPCPSDITLAVETANFGKEADGKGTCTGANLTAGNMVQGLVPTKTLGLDDDMAFDSWGRRIRYTVDKRYTEDQGFLTYEVTASASSFAFLGVDTTTQGSWIGTYGKDGYGISEGTNPFVGSTSNPSYGSFVVSGYGGHTWAGTSADVRATQFPNGSDRIAACWYSNGNFNIDVMITDGKPHILSIYMLDWDTAGARSATVDVKNAAGTVTLDSQSVTNYQNGKYYSWVVNESVKLDIDLVAGPNSVVSGIFFDPVPKHVFALTSHGANGHGGYPRGGGVSMFNAGSTNTRELTNCACTNTAAAGTFTGAAESGAPTEHATVASDKFDDIVLVRYRNDLF